MSKKKGFRRIPTFVNLKSNTMKNTVQRYRFPDNLQTSDPENHPEPLIY